MNVLLSPRSAQIEALESIMFHPDLRLLRSFAAVAAENNVTRAAQRLNLTQPTVSGQIKELEQEIGFPLFHRTTRNISLSNHGERLLPIVRAILSQAEVLRDEVETMQAVGRSHFRLGAAMYTMDFRERTALLDAFGLAMPSICYTIDNRLQSAQIPDLLADRLDAAILLGINARVTENDAGSEHSVIVNEVQYPDTLERIVLQRRWMSLLIPDGSPLLSRSVLRQSDLRGQKIAIFSHEHGNALTDPIETFFRGCGADLVIPAEGNALAVERYALRNNICALGVGWFPVQPGLVARDVEGMRFFLDYAVVLSPGANRAARSFFSFARQWQTVRESTPVAA